MGKKLLSLMIAMFLCFSVAVAVHAEENILDETEKNTVEPGELSHIQGDSINADFNVFINPPEVQSKSGYDGLTITLVHNETEYKAVTSRDNWDSDMRRHHLVFPLGDISVDDQFIITASGGQYFKQLHGALKVMANTPTSFTLYDGDGVIPDIGSMVHWDWETCAVDFNVGHDFNNQVFVTVKDELDNVVSGIEMRVSSSNGSRNKTVTTDVNGEFAISLDEFQGGVSVISLNSDYAVSGNNNTALTSKKNSHKEAYPQEEK